jgi:nucleoside-diphosphate-sugar epimerase
VRQEASRVLWAGHLGRACLLRSDEVTAELERVEMKVFVAGASGAIGRRLVPLLVEAGHEVIGTTRHPEAAELIAAQGAEPVLVDVYDAERLTDAVARCAPDAVIHQLTDLASMDFAANAKLRTVGTPNLVAAARAAGVERIVAQSIAWIYAPGSAAAVETDPLDPDASAYEGIVALEQSVAELPDAVVLRYGSLYGPGTWYAPDGAFAAKAFRGELTATPAWTSFVHVDDAAFAALAALEWPAGAVNIVDDEPAPGLEWVPRFCEAIGASPPPVDADAEAGGRPVSNAAAHELGWQPRHGSWRTGFAPSVEPNLT